MNKRKFLIISIIVVIIMIITVLIVALFKNDKEDNELKEETLADNIVIEKEEIVVSDAPDGLQVTIGIDEIDDTDSNTSNYQQSNNNQLTNNKPSNNSSDNAPQSKPEENPEDDKQERILLKWEEYCALSAEEKDAYIDSFDSLAEYFEWMEKAKSEFKEEYPTIEIGPDGSIDLSKLN